MNRAKATRIESPEIESTSAPSVERKLHVAPARAPFPPAVAAPPALCTARIDHLDGDGVWLVVGGVVVSAERDESLHPAVLAGAAERGERVLAERGVNGVWVVVGALRTQPTPGIDVADEYTIEAGKVAIRGKQEISLGNEAAGLVIRAIGEVETYADKIISRAEGVHKIIGRMLRLN